MYIYFKIGMAKFFKNWKVTYFDSSEQDPIVKFSKNYILKKFIH